MNSGINEMEQVMRDMCEGSAEAFDRFYARYAPFVLQLAKRMMHDPAEAEDLCHDVFLEVIKKGFRYDHGRGSIEAWLAVMTRSRCLDKLRRSRRIAVGEQADRQLHTDRDETERLAVRRIQREALQEALQALPARQKEAVAYSYLAARTQQELADSWNVPLGTVKSWIRYGVGNMRKYLESKGWRDDSEGREGRK